MDRFRVMRLEDIPAIPIPGAGTKSCTASFADVLVAPAVHRHVATQPGTEVLAFGGDPVFRPSGSEYIWRVQAAGPPTRASGSAARSRTSLG